MAGVMMALGDFRFSLSTAAYGELERTRSFRWAEQERVGRAPARQFVGVGADEISLSGTVFPHHAGGLGQIARMAEVAREGEPLQLTDGRGVAWGRYCILRVGEGQSHIDGRGVPWRQDFELDLVAYGDDA